MNAYSTRVRIARRGVAVLLPMLLLFYLLGTIGRQGIDFFLTNRRQHPHSGQTDGLEEQSHPSGSPAPCSPSVDLVMSTLENDNLLWVHENLLLEDLKWSLIPYILDTPAADYTVPKNKGRESMAYLTYIINVYDHVPDVVIFIHSSRFQWHNDDPLYDQVEVLKNLNLANVRSKGYVNLRCAWYVGCPVQLLPQSALKSPTRKFSQAGFDYQYGKEWSKLFPETPVPDRVGASCCAQFAVSREKIRQRPVEDYKRYRDWLLNTALGDDIAGRVMEYAWHIIFGMPAVHCPSLETCYCETFGYCNITCEESNCSERYTIPPFSTLPKGWPKNGWDSVGVDLHDQSGASMKGNWLGGGVKA